MTIIWGVLTMNDV